MQEISKDRLWKGIIEDLFEDFLWYFFPDWTQKQVDLSKSPEFFDKELDEIYPKAKENKNRYADKLVKVFTKDGKEKWILLHIEVQGYKDLNFPERMFIYFYRIRERWGKDVMTLVIFTDDDKDYLPNEYTYQYEKTKVTYNFNTFKLLNKNEKELNVVSNPFSIIMLVARKSLDKQNRGDHKQLLWKKDLVQALKKANYPDLKIRRILNFIRFYVKFESDNHLNILDRDIQQILKQRKNMGIEEEILEGVKEAVTEEVTKKVTAQVTAQVTLQNKIHGVQKALRRGKLTLNEIAEDFEVDLDFVKKVKNGEIQ